MSSERHSDLISKISELEITVKELEAKIMKHSEKSKWTADVLQGKVLYKVSVVHASIFYSMIIFQNQHFHIKSWTSILFWIILVCRLLHIQTAAIIISTVC